MNSSHKEDIRKRYGFDENWNTHLVVGYNTYAIKDYLREQGATYNTLLKWHCAKEFDIPDDFEWITISFDDVYSIEKDEDYEFVVQKNSASAFVKKVVRMATPLSLSEWAWNKNEKYKNETVTFDSIHGFLGNFGWTNIVKFKQGHNAISWFTTKDDFPEYEKGEPLIIDFTVVGFDTYNDEKYTKVKNVKIKRLGE